MRSARLIRALYAACHLVLSARGQAIDSLPACGQTCITKVKGGAGALGCTDPKDLRCLCPKPDYLFGIRDCASSSCGGDVAATVTDAAKAECATATLAPSSSSSSQNTPTPTHAPTSAAATSSTSSIRTGSINTSSTVTDYDKPVSGSSSSSLHSSSSPATPTNPGISSASTATVGTSTHSTTAIAASPTSSAVSHQEESSNNGMAGLTSAAKAGIGIGAVTAVAILIALAVFLVIRRRDSNKSGYLDNKPLAISEPLPGSSGRAFDYDAGQQQYITGVSELEMKSRRYEDMIPRQVPRHLV